MTTRLVAGLAIVLSTGCSTVNVARHRTAAPMGTGNKSLSVGMQIPKEAGHGIDRDDGDGARVSQHHAPIFLSLLDLGWDYGLNDRVDFEGRLFATGAKAGLRWTFLNGSITKGAIGGGVGAFSGDYEQSYDPTHHSAGRISAAYADFAATFSLHPRADLAVFFGPLLTRFEVFASLRDYEETGATETPISRVYRRHSGTWEPGFFLGVRIGKRIQISPGITAYLEPTEYPFEGFKNRRVFAYPFIALSVTRLSSKAFVPSTEPTGEDEWPKEPEPPEPQPGPEPGEGPLEPPEPPQ